MHSLLALLLVLTALCSSATAVEQASTADQATPPIANPVLPIGPIDVPPEPQPSLSFASLFNQRAAVDARPPKSAGQVVALQPSESAGEHAAADQPAGSADSEQLAPFPLLFPRLPSLNLFDTLKMFSPSKLFGDLKEAASGVVANPDTSADSAAAPPPRRGMLTIMLIKSGNNQQQPEQPVALLPESGHEPLVHFKSKLIMFQFAPKRTDDESSGTGVQHLMGGPHDPDQLRMHLLGGAHDMADHRLGGGGAAALNDQQDGDDQQQRLSAAASFMSLFNFGAHPQLMSFQKHGAQDDEDDTIGAGQHAPVMSDDVGRNPPAHAQMAKKKCMMLSFMRLKASVYYRTVIHLLFVSGLAMLAMLLVVVCARVYRQKRAHRQYRRAAAELSVATIDRDADQLIKKQPLSYFQHLTTQTGGAGATKALEHQALVREAAASMTTLTAPAAPPAYDQVAAHRQSQQRKSSLVNSLAAAYQLRFGGGVSTGSVSSLPAYNDKATGAGNSSA